MKREEILAKAAKLRLAAAAAWERGDKHGSTSMHNEAARLECLQETAETIHLPSAASIDPPPDATVRVNVHDLARILHELCRAQTQVTELQARGTALVEEKRGLDRQTMVQSFMRAFDQPISEMPGELPTKPGLHGFLGDELVRFRLRIFVEEVFETLRAGFSKDDVLYTLLDVTERDVLQVVDDAKIDIDMVELIDGSIDTEYVLQGLRDTLGFDSAPFWKIIHATNMAKLGPEGKPVRRASDGKVEKPVGWKPPDDAIAAEIQRQREEAKKRP